MREKYVRKENDKKIYTTSNIQGTYRARKHIDIAVRDPGALGIVQVSTNVGVDGTSGSETCNYKS
jgi:hypothetical protein